MGQKQLPSGPCCDRRMTVKNNARNNALFIGPSLGWCASDFNAKLHVTITPLRSGIFSLQGAGMVISCMLFWTVATHREWMNQKLQYDVVDGKSTSTS